MTDTHHHAGTAVTPQQHQGPERHVTATTRRAQRSKWDGYNNAGPDVYWPARHTNTAAHRASGRASAAR